MFYKLLIYLFIFQSFCIFINAANAKVEKPNYSFTFDRFKTFYPGQKLSDIQKKYKSTRMINKGKGINTFEIQIRHNNYFFPVFINIREGVVFDFYAKLPNYFLHDLFHQSMINRFGKQDKFINKDETSVYIWSDFEGKTITYSGACTITCFPIFVHMINKGDSKSKSSLLVKLLRQNE